jgi:toxin ParE1/3/4
LIGRTRYYRSAGGDGLGERFFDSTLAALRVVERMPGIGSPLAGEMCDIPGLRSFPVKGFPVRWYFFVGGDHLDVVRLLSDWQDLTAILGSHDVP